MCTWPLLALRNAHNAPNATATLHALLVLKNAHNVPNLTLDHCVSQKWLNEPNTPVAALDLGV